MPTRDEKKTLTRVTQSTMTAANLNAHEMLGNINRIIMLKEMQQNVIGKEARDDLMKARALVCGVIKGIEER